MGVLKCVLLFLSLILTLQGSMSMFNRPLVTRTTQPPKKVPRLKVTKSLLEQAFTRAQADAANRIQIEDNLPPSGYIQATEHSVEARHQRFLAFTNRTSELDQNAALFDSASRFIAEKMNLNKDEATFGLENVRFPLGSLAAEAKSQCKALQSFAQCDKDSKFRTIDASCNNLEHPTWGKAFTCMGRILPPDYAEGVSSPRLPAEDNPLPNPRQVSVLVHEALTTPNGDFTIMVMAFGQFLNHDITMGLMTRSIRNHTMLSCCPFGQSNHPECSMGIEILHNDTDFFTSQKQTCMNFVRSALCSENCALGPRQHSNQITTYMDNSNVYGSSSEENIDLRTFKGGLLKSQIYQGEEFLPNTVLTETDQCSIAKEDKICFSAGDHRANEQPLLASMHTIWMRHHNRLARELGKINSSLSDEQIFQLSRRILNAQYQFIVMNEYMPKLIGPVYMKFFNLNSGKDSKYNSKLQCTLFNEFMTAANRFGHTLIQNTIQEGTNASATMNLADVYLSPFILRLDHMMDPIVSGLASQPGKVFDNHLVTAVTRDLYKQKQLPFGMDLATLNVQRGRDQGTAGYIHYLKHCFNWSVTSFEELKEIMPDDRWKNLRIVYKNSLENIDLFTGGVSETPLEGAVVGPTFGCLIGIQTHRFKFGDRFFFEHLGQAGSFSKPQLREIRRTTFSQIICENTISVKSIARNSFLLTDSKENPYVNCSSYQKIDLTLFVNPKPN